MKPEKRARSVARRELLALMESISEDHFFASWHNNLEFELWSELVDFRTGHSVQDSYDISVLSALVVKANGCAFTQSFDGSKLWSIFV